MQFISPCRRGDVRSSLVATVTGSRFDLVKIAAPKSLQPSETLDRVSGTMDDSVTSRSLETRASARCKSMVQRDTMAFMRADEAM
jgi:hypothetical protein